MNAFKISFSLQKISIFCFFIICLILTRQVPFSFLSPLSNVALMVLFLIHLPKDKYYIFFSLILLGLGGYSIIAENNIPTIIRFIIVLWSIGTAYYIRLPIQILKIIVYLSLIQCFVIIGFEFFMVFLKNEKLCTLIRNYVLLIGWGDIYTLNGIYYKIQIKGNAILPFIYMLSYSYRIFPQRYDILFKLIFFISIIFSGQFAFLIAIVAFHVYFLFRRINNNKRLLYISYSFLLFLSITFVPIYNYIKQTLEMKSDESSAIRIEQATLLLKDLGESPITLIMGKGMGNTLSVQTSFRDYTDNIYFELQILYILNQLGIIAFIIFSLYNIYLTITKIKYKELIFVYLFYIMYAITNPYIFDTNHIIVILTLCSISNYLTNKKYNNSLPLCE